MAGLSGQIFNIQHFSTEDGPGIRTTVFMKGCPLKCRWCANPESQSRERQAAWRSSMCIGCKSCLAACEKGAVSFRAGGLDIDRSICDSCGKCVSACPSGAMSFFGRCATADEVFGELLRDKGYYEQSGGGITLSGGECMSQPEFAAAILGLCKKEGIHTAVDTSGVFGRDALDMVSEYTDLFLYDLKHMDEKAHLLLTGTSNRAILQNLKIMSAEGMNIILRIPVIPGANDSDENLMATAEFIAALPRRHHVDLLPYHDFGRPKYHMLGMAYPMEGVKKPGELQKEHYLSIFQSCGLDCTIH